MRQRHNHYLDRQPTGRFAVGRQPDFAQAYRIPQIFGFRKFKDANSDERATFDNVVVKDHSGNALFSDGFSNTTGLLNFSDVPIVNGELSFADGSSPNLVLQTIFDSCSKYTVSLDFTIVRDAAAFVFGAQDERNYYMWQVNVNADPQKTLLRMFLCQNGSYTQLGPDVDITSIIPKRAQLNTVYTMRMQADNCYIQTYINDTPCASISGPLVKNGGVGFRAYDNGLIRESLTCGSFKAMDFTGTAVFSDNISGGDGVKFLSGTVENGPLIVTK